MSSSIFSIPKVKNLETKSHFHLFNITKYTMIIPRFVIKHRLSSKTILSLVLTPVPFRTFLGSLSSLKKTFAWKYGFFPSCLRLLNELSRRNYVSFFILLCFLLYPFQYSPLEKIFKNLFVAFISMR